MDEVEKLASEVIRRLKGDGPVARQGAGEPRVGGAGSGGGTDGGGIPVAVSGRHIHVARGVLDRLFGEGFQLTKRSDLRQPGEFASEQTVTLMSLLNTQAPKRSNR